MYADSVFEPFEGWIDLSQGSKDSNGNFIKNWNLAEHGKLKPDAPQSTIDAFEKFKELEKMNKERNVIA